jgi:hypothetical protein
MGTAPPEFAGRSIPLAEVVGSLPWWGVLCALMMDLVFPERAANSTWLCLGLMLLWVRVWSLRDASSASRAWGRKIPTVNAGSQAQ